MATLFEHFEVNHSPFWPRIGRLLGASLGVHALAMAAFLYVPGVRDALNLAFLFSDTQFVSRDYTRTVIGDEVQMVNLASGKFRYPDGYFAPEGAQLPPLEIAAAPVIVSQPGPGPALLPAATPIPESSPSPSPEASPAAGSSPSPATVIATSSPSPAGSPRSDNKKTDVAREDKAQTPDEAQKELDKVAAENKIELPKEGEINKEALKDFVKFAKDLKDQGKLDLNKPFEIVIEAELDEHGKLKDPRFTKKAGDPNLVALSGRMIAALNDSGFLIYLKRINQDNPGTKVIFTIKQDQSEVIATVESDASSVNSARSLSQAFNFLLAAGARSRAGKDEEVLLKNTTVAPDGKRIKFNLTMPRQPVVDLIIKQMAAS